VVVVAPVGAIWNALLPLIEVWPRVIEPEALPCTS
jgi:hypothetical protein